MKNESIREEIKYQRHKQKRKVKGLTKNYAFVNLVILSFAKSTTLSHLV